jgi:hypothetical protein
MDKLAPEELRVVKLGVDSRLADDHDDPALLAALKQGDRLYRRSPGRR